MASGIVTESLVGTLFESQRASTGRLIKVDSLPCHCNVLTCICRFLDDAEGVAREADVVWRLKKVNISLVGQVRRILNDECARL